MKQQIAAGIVAVSMVGGVGTGVVVHDRTARRPASRRPKPSPRRTTTTTADPKRRHKAAGVDRRRHRQAVRRPRALPVIPLGSLRITAGAVGPV